MSLVTCTWVEQLILEKHLVALNGIMFRFLQEKVYSGKIGCNWPHTTTHNTTGSLETAESYLLVQGLWHSSYIRRSFSFRSQRNLFTLLRKKYVIFLYPWVRSEVGNISFMIYSSNYVVKGYMPVPVICRATNTSYQRKYILYTFKTKV